MNQNKAGQTHDQLQAACWKEAQRDYFPLLRFRLFANPNDMHAGNVARWKQYEALGVVPGVWDMVLHWFEAMRDLRGNRNIILPAVHWFEFKVGSDELSANQKKFREIFLPLGHKFYIISEQEEFRITLKNIIEPNIAITKQIWKE